MNETLLDHNNYVAGSLGSCSVSNDGYDSSRTCSNAQGIPIFVYYVLFLLVLLFLNEELNFYLNIGEF